MVRNNREYELISDLFYSTNPCNRLLAFELAKSANCYKDVILDLHQELSEFPHFDLIVNANSFSYEATSSSPKQEDRIESYRQSIEHFCDLYFKPIMNLNGYNLSGVTAKYLTVFPRVLLKCTFVEELDLSHNDLCSLPEEIGSLHNLRVLNLSSNPQLCGLPKAIGQLYNLEHLNLSGICNLFFRPQKEQLSFLMTESLRPLKNLRYLNLQNVRLKALPDWVGEWKQLETLHLYSGNQQGSLPFLSFPTSFTNLSCLRTLTIDAYKVHLPEDIHRLESLECLVVSHVCRTPAGIGRLRQLHYLDLSYFSDDHPIHSKEGNTTGDLTKDDLPFEHSRLDLLDWNWLLEMTWLEEFVCKQAPPWAFTETEKTTLRQALPQCTLSFQ